MCVLDTGGFRHYIEKFNELYVEDVVNAVPDSESWLWLQQNIPFFECSDRSIEEIYYFRWWVYRKHIKDTPDGFVVTEFLPLVKHGLKHNTINCPIGHQLYDGRWIKEPKYLDDYSRFMLRGDGELHRFSSWFADAVFQRYCVSLDEALVVEFLDDFVDYYQKWEEQEVDGLFHFTPWMDGMEFSISGNEELRFRPTLNAYMFADALAISRVAEIAGRNSMAEEFRAKASSIKSKVQTTLWHPDLEFFASRNLKGEFTPEGNPVREAVGYVPWYFNLPDKGYEVAWEHLNESDGFNTPVGLTTAEVRHPRFLKVNPERMASWDGAIWPFATSQTLTALQNILRNYDQPYVTASDYIRELHKYAVSHLRDGKPSISEVVRDPYLAEMCGSEHYNHSTFCDLVITGAAGVVPRADDFLEISPLIPDEWDYFCLDGVLYHGHTVAVAWDRTGARYGEIGFHVYIDGKRRHSSDSMNRVKIDLSESCEEGERERP